MLFLLHYRATQIMHNQKERVLETSWFKRQKEILARIEDIANDDPYVAAMDLAGASLLLFSKLYPGAVDEEINDQIKATNNHETDEEVAARSISNEGLIHALRSLYKSAEVALNHSPLGQCQAFVSQDESLPDPPFSQLDESVSSAFDRAIEHSVTPFGAALSAVLCTLRCCERHNLNSLQAHKMLNVASLYLIDGEQKL